MLGPVLFNNFIYDIEEKNASSANLQMTPSEVVQLTCLKDR